MVTKIIVMVVVALIMLYKFWDLSHLRSNIDLSFISLASIITFIVFTVFMITKQDTFYIPVIVMVALSLLRIIYRIIRYFTDWDVLEWMIDHSRKFEKKLTILDILSEFVIIAGVVFAVV